MTAHPHHRGPSSTPLQENPVGGRGWRVLDEPASIQFLPSGTPLALRWRGSLWQVIGEPLSWSSSRSWWEPGPTPRGGQGSIITTRFWRFHAQTSQVSPVLHFDISADPRWDHWRLRRISGVEGY